MSFRDVGRSSLAPIISSPRRTNKRRNSPPREQPSPSSSLHQIAEALKDHKRDRHVLKEQCLISHSTTVPRYNSPSCVSAFSKLNDEIVQFQKMVNDLHKVVDSDVMTPEDQWRTRILLKSAESADNDLAVKIKQSPLNKKSVTVIASFSKLRRDFERAHKTYQTTVKIYHAKQNAEAALLSSTLRDKPEPRSVGHRKSAVMHEAKEDFFDRTMREREEETKKINTKIHAVNNLYQELGRLVTDQQEDIDLVEDQIRYARANTEVGLDRLQKSRGGMFGIRSEREQPPPVIAEEELNWRLPFQTFRHDIFEVRNDLVDLVHVGAKKITNLGNREIFQCGQTSDDLSTVV